MKDKTEALFSGKKFFSLLFLGALLLLFFNLGKRPLFGAEGRWVEGVREMLLRGDLWVPTINGVPHVTKPLLPYWLIMFWAQIGGGLNEWTARLPAALCGLLALGAFYDLAKRLLSREEAWLLTGLFLTSFGFFNYARLTQSEIYQLAWIIAALAWYVRFREKRSFGVYFGFWLLVDLAAWSKGLTGLAVPCLVVLLDWVVRGEKRHLNAQAFLATVLGLGLHFLPYYGTARAMGSDLPFHLIVRENLLQAVNPYDHREPFYVYLFYWPELLLPWTPLLFLALFWAVKNWKNLSPSARWVLVANLGVFFLFTLARCRRFYYILPIVPLSFLLIGFYLREEAPKWSKHLKPVLLSVLVLEIVVFAFLQPLLSSPAEKVFGQAVKETLRQNPSLKLCAFKKVAANVFFYLDSPEPVFQTRSLEETTSCDLLFFRERYFRRDKRLQSLKGRYWLVPRKARSKDLSKNYVLVARDKGLKVSGLIPLKEKKP